MPVRVHTVRTPLKIGLTAHVLSRLGDRRPTALDGVKAIPDAWEDEEHLAHRVFGRSHPPMQLGVIDRCL